MVRTTNLARDFAALSERLPASTLSIELDADEGLHFIRVTGCGETELGCLLYELGAVVIEFRHQRRTLASLLDQ